MFFNLALRHLLKERGAKGEDQEGKEEEEDVQQELEDGLVEAEGEREGGLVRGRGGRLAEVLEQDLEGGHVAAQQVVERREEVEDLDALEEGEGPVEPVRPAQQGGQVEGGEARGSTGRKSEEEEGGGRGEATRTE